MQIKESERNEENRGPVDRDMEKPNEPIMQRKDMNNKTRILYYGQRVLLN